MLTWEYASEETPGDIRKLCRKEL